MPTYDYVCKSCGHELEEFQSMSAKPLKKCPKCGKNTLERKIGIGAGVLFKGGGFYETDYRSDGYKKSAEADKKAAEPVKVDGAGATAAKAETPKDSKPAKSEAKKPSASKKSSGE